MVEPFAIVGGVASILQIISSVTKLAKSLNEVRESYNNVALNTTLVASQLSTIRAALEALHAWRVSDTEETEASVQLDKDLGMSLSCCAILITVIDGKLEESGYQPEFGMKQKMKYLWLEEILKEYVSNLEGQVRALQLLLTIFQCRTVTEKKQELAKRESRMVMEQMRAETMTLGIGEEELDDAASIWSQDPSVHLDIDSEIMKSPAYKRVYGEGGRHDRRPQKSDPNRRLWQNIKKSEAVPARTDTSGPPKQSDSSNPVRIHKQPPPPPPPRRQRVPSPAPEANPKIVSHKSHPLPPNYPDVDEAMQSSIKISPEKSVPPLEIAPQPPPIPSRPKPRQRSSHADTRAMQQGHSDSQGKINVWGSLGPDQGEKDHSATMVTADSILVSELPREPQPNGSKAVPAERSGEILPTDPIAVVPSSTKPENSEQMHAPEPPNISPPYESHLGRALPDLSSHVRVHTTEKGIPETPASIKGFRDQMDHAFEDRDHFSSSTEGLRLSFDASGRKALLRTQREEGDTEDGLKHDKSNITTNESPNQALGARGQNETSDSLEPESKDMSARMSISSSVDLYGASVRNMPSGGTSRAHSLQSHSAGEGGRSQSEEALDDERVAQTEGFSILSPPLMSKTEGSAADLNSISSARGDEDNVPGDSVVCSDTVPQKIESSTILKPELSLSPSITMTLAEGVADQQVSQSPMSFEREYTIPALPSRAPPSPPSRPVPIPPIPQSYSPTFDPGTRTSAVETSTTSTGRDSSIVETVSTISSSEPSVDNSASTMHQSASNTVATSVSVDPQRVAREQAQSDLRRLQNELAAAKKSGDSTAAQASLAKSIEVIRATYLTASAPPAPLDGKKPRSSRLGTRASILRFPSLPGSSKGIALGDAAAAGDVETVISLIESRGVDARTDNHKTPLMRAAINGHSDCMNVLKQHGADEFAVDARGRTVLHMAIESNNLAAVRWLLDAYPIQRPQALKHRSSILSRATSSIVSRSAKNLREASDAEGLKPLHVAVAVDQGGMVRTLLAAGVDVESKNNWGRTPLHQAILYKRRDSFEALIRHGASMKVLDAQGMSSIHLAAKVGQTDIVHALLEKGAARNEFDSDGHLPVHEAALAGNILCIEALILEPKDLSTKTKAGETLLHLACLMKNVELATYLLKQGVEANPWAPPQATLLHNLDKFKVPLSSLTPLHYASCKGDYEMALVLVDHEAWVNAATPEGVTPLMMAVESEDTNTVNLLLNRGAKVNAMMPETLLTALHISARRGDLETVQQLCRAGANDSARANTSSYGRTPAEEAQDRCTDKLKREAVTVYLRTIRNNRWRNSRLKTQASHAPQPYEMVGRANSTDSSLNVRPMQPISYASWGQTQLAPIQQQQMAQYTYQQQAVGAYPSATYPPLTQQQQSQLLAQQYYDPMHDAMPTQVVESPPPYEPGGANISARMANQAPVHRPGDGPQGGPKYM